MGRPGGGRRRGSRGFTLVELLVALFALSLMAVMSWRGLDGMVRAQAQTQTRADDVLALQVGLQQWQADLDAIQQMPQMSALDWNGRVLRMTRLGSTAAADFVEALCFVPTGGGSVTVNSGGTSTTQAVPAGVTSVKLALANGVQSATLTFGGNTYSVVSPITVSNTQLVQDPSYYWFASGMSGSGTYPATYPATY